MVTDVIAAVVGNLRKMHIEPGQPATYALHLIVDAQDKIIPLNACLGKNIKLEFLGEINCKHCGRKTPKSYQQGYCYPCMMRLAECDMCIIRPEKCHFEAGTCRDESWAHAHCGVPHIVYLANTSGLKVGITRETQIPTRWLDQGATQALPMYRVANRFQSGIVEVTLKEFISDRTNWRAMLKGSGAAADLVHERKQLLDKADAKLQPAIARFKAGDVQQLATDAVFETDYPVLTYPEKVSSLSFDKQPEVSGQLLGIKGQYLILDCGVINLRKFAAYKIKFSSN